MTVLCIITAALAITVIALIMHIQFLKIEVDYARSMAKLYKESYESEQESFKNMSELAEKCNQEAITVLSHYNYEHYKVLTMLNGIKYAEHFLKPRKRREMWHRMRVKTYDEWKQEQDTPQEL
jgi:predicted metallo-beta-lactamase superfamily hydrolase